MKKNGFTLVELIATIVLMSMLATVILINMVGVKDDQDQRSAKKFDKSVEEAACTYIDMKERISLRESCKNDSTQSSCYISIDTLIKSGLIEEDLEDKKTGKLAGDDDERNIKIWVHFDGNPKEKKCTIQR